MRCLSLWQPWASLLVHGRKRIETRGWPMGHRGPLLIHATKRFTPEQAEICHREPFRTALAALGMFKSGPPAGVDFPLAEFAGEQTTVTVALGAIVGLVEVTHCIPTDRVGRWENTPGERNISSLLDDLGVMGPGDGKPFLFVSDTERAFGDYSPGRFAIRCSEFIAFEKPIPYPGRQGLFDVPDEVTREAYGHDTVR